MVEAHFLAECQGKQFQFDTQSLATLAQLRSFAEKHAENLSAFVSALDEKTSAQEIDGQIGQHTFHLLVWQVLLQLFMHSAQHRGELSILLSGHGYPVPIDDIIVHFAEERGQPWPWYNEV